MRPRLFRPLPWVFPVFVIVGTTLMPGVARADAQIDFPTLPLRFMVAPWSHDSAHADGWLEEQVRHANRIFAPTGVSFAEVEQQALPVKHARMETRRDRHRLGALTEDDVINVFVVQSLRDVDDRSGYRHGVHWRSRFYEGEHYVILSMEAGPDVLAHELGHFFGNRRHPETPGNIMSYNRGERPPFFNKRQTRRIHRFARRYLRSGELEPVARQGPAAARDAGPRERSHATDQTPNSADSAKGRKSETSGSVSHLSSFSS